jgi:hypothetical protein
MEPDMTSKSKPQPPQTCSGDEAKERMARANSAPIDVALLAPDPWSHVGGSVEFKWNGQPIRAARQKS